MLKGAPLVIDISDALLGLLRQYAPQLPASDADARSALLPEAGLVSMSTVKFMLALEAKFGIAIPDADLTPENFMTFDAISLLVQRSIPK